MHMGLQTFDENGNITLDTNDTLCRYCGAFKIKEGRQFIKIDKEREERFWWYFVRNYQNINQIQEVFNGIWVDSDGDQVMVVGVY